MKLQGRYYFILILAGLTLSGCSIDASIENMTSKVAELLQSKATNNEFVPASQQNVVTAQNYKVQSSLSYHSSNQDTIVTADGYKVQTSVQSTLYSE